MSKSKIFGLLSLILITVLGWGYLFKTAFTVGLGAEYNDPIPTYIPGMVTTYDVTARVNWEFQGTFFKNYESMFPLSHFSREVKRSNLKTSEFFWFEQYGRPDKLTVTTGFTQGTAGATKNMTVTANDANFITKNMVFELLVANSDPSTLTTEVIVTGVSGTTVTVAPTNYAKGIVAFADGSKYAFRGTSATRGDVKSTPNGWGAVKKYGTTRIFKNSYSLDNTSMHEDYYGEGERANLREQHEYLHREDMEYAKLFSKENTFVDATNKKRSSYIGFEQRCINDSPINLLYSGPYDHSAVVKHHNQNTFQVRRIQGKHNHRLALCNRAYISFYTEEVNKRVIVEDFDSVKTYGVPDVVRVRVGGGTLDLKEHYMITSKYDDIEKPAAFFAHMRYVETRPFNGRDTHWQMNIQEDGQDGVQDEILTEEGFFMAAVEQGMHSVMLPQ